MKNDIVERIKDVAKLEDVAADYMELKNAGSELQGKCPVCGKTGKGKGMTISPSKQIFKCFHCDAGGKGALNFLQTTQNMTFKDALQELSQRYNIEMESESDRKKRLQMAAKKRKKHKGKDFVELQLEGSGLTFDDVRATIREESKTREQSPYRRGCLNDYWQLMPGEGDDMLIYYYDLDGNPVEYLPKKQKTPQHFYRIRFQNPDTRKDRNGKPMKYYSPAGSGTQLYIPEKIRKLYKARKKIKRLYLQEGEKKAEKACKHNVLSVGLMGIHNVGSNNVMPRDLHTLIMQCDVEEVCIVYDSDWQDISQNIKVGDNVQQRPYSFFRSLQNFKEYMLTFRNSGVNLEVYFAAVKKNEQDDKGLDDLLANTLKDDPDKINDDIEYASNAKDGHGDHIEIHKITALTDYQIKNFWYLNSSSDFAKRHIDVLRNLPEFNMYKTKYRINDDDELELAEPLLPEEKYYEVDERGRPQFRYSRCFTFLQNRGYGRIEMLGKRYFVHMRNNIVKFVDQVHIQDFVIDTTKEVADENILDMIYRGISQYLGPQHLEHINDLDIKFETPEKHAQNLHFSDKFWKIGKNNVTELATSARKEAVWQDKIHKHQVKLLAPLIKFHKQEDGSFKFHLSEDGKKAHFLQFLINASNFKWKTSRKISDLDQEDQKHSAIHLLSKLTAFGFLCHRYHDASKAKAIICMDGKNSEVGASNGRSGKSLFGLAIDKVVPQVYIGGKSKKLTEDDFIYEEVTEKTENVFFDDVRANIDFEFFFPQITGRWMINKKGIGRNTLPTHLSPKLLFSTNHAINGEGSSFKDRQHTIVFSDYYNDHHKPTDDFGLLFWDEWDQRQWNYFYNLVAVSLQLYFKYGLVEAPTDDIELRRLRQTMGEAFLQWADAYFSRDEYGHSDELNAKIPRTELYDKFKEQSGATRYMTPTRFGRSMKAFVKYKGWHMNPSMPNDMGQNIDDFLAAGGKSFIGNPDKRGGVEYWELTDNYGQMPEDDKPF